MVDRLVESQNRVLIMLCDVPCSGTATTEKTEMFGLIGLKKSGSMFDVPVGIAERAAMMLNQVERWYILLLN